MGGFSMKFRQYLQLKEEENIQEDISLIVNLIPILMAGLLMASGISSSGKTLNPLTAIKNFWKGRKVIKKMKSMPKEELEKIAAELSSKISEIDKDVPYKKQGYDPNWKANLNKVIKRNNLENDLSKLKIELNKNEEDIDKQEFLTIIKKIKDSIKIDDATIEKLALTNAEE